MARTDPEIITAPVDAFCRISGLGKTKVFELIADGTLESIKIGRRRLVVIESWRRYIAERGTGPPSFAR